MSVSFFFISTILYLINFFYSIFINYNQIFITTFLNFIASILGFISSLIVILNNDVITYTFQTSLSNILIDKFTFKIQPYTCYSLILIYFISTLVTLYSKSYVSTYESKKIKLINSITPLFIISMVFVLITEHVILFLIFWELMSLLSFLLVMTDYDDFKTRTAGFTYLIMTHFGVMFIIAFFAYLYVNTNSLQFQDYYNFSTKLTNNETLFLFLFILLGFGSKAGIIPLHIWLPLAHPKAPSNISALMSAIMVKVAIFVFLKFTYLILNGANFISGIILLIISIITALLGVMYSLVESDLKTCLAFSTIENVGLILMSMACSIIFYSYQKFDFSIFALYAMLFHILTHAIFKALLFMSAGEIIHLTHTQDLNQMGGIIKLIPYTSIFFLIAVMSMAALPPTSGFISEWLLFQTILLSTTLPNLITKLIMPICGSILALISVFALVSSVRLYFSIFLAKSRNLNNTFNKKIASSYYYIISMSLLSLSSILLGVFSNFILKYIGHILKFTFPIQKFNNINLCTNHFIFPINTNISSISPITVFLMLCTTLIMIYLIVNHLYKNQIQIYETWSCGSDIHPSMEYTPQSYVQPLILVFSKIYLPSTYIQSFYNESRLIKREINYTQKVTLIFEKLIYKPFIKILIKLSKFLKRIQVGYIHVYLFYIFITLILLIAFI